MHIYAFGSVCRGEVTTASDVDLLAITAGYDGRFDAAQYSIYSYDRVREIWAEGNPFAWHLFIESKLIYAEDGNDFLKELGTPTTYSNTAADCAKFLALFQTAENAIRSGTNSEVFELSNIFLAVRNFATCYSLGISDKAIFSREAALRIGVDSLKIDSAAYAVLENARLLCTRGEGSIIGEVELDIAVRELTSISQWMSRLMERVTQNA